MALLHHLRHGSNWLRRRVPGGIARARPLLILLAGLAACGPDPELRPDQRLQDELGLSSRDEVHRISISGGEQERAEPAEVTVPQDAYVEFVSTDSWVHEVRFELDSLEGPARDFLEGTDQSDSPPLVNADSRFLVSWAGAPPGRYPFRIEGNGAPVAGVVIVASGG